MAYNLKIIDVSIDDLNYRLDYSSFDTVSLTSTPTNHNTECLSVNDRIDSIDSIDSQSNYDQPLLGVSSNEIDNWYNIARKNGAIGGKILGAGAGGFLLLYAEKSKHEKICSSLPNLNKIDFNFENEGSKIIYYDKQ